MEPQTIQDDLQKTGNLKSYVTGLLISVALTLVSYFLVTEHLIKGFTLDIALAILSLIQVGFQLCFFLHLGEEKHPKWNLISFLFMVLVIGILVIGSLWIMYNLNYRMM